MREQEPLSPWHLQVTFMLLITALRPASLLWRFISWRADSKLPEISLDSLSDVDKVLSKFVSVLNIVSTAAPDPGRLQVLGSAGSTAATAGQLAVPAAPGDAVD